jgi:hypothetical protein
MDQRYKVECQLCLNWLVNLSSVLSINHLWLIKFRVCQTFEYPQSSSIDLTKLIHEKVLFREFSNTIIYRAEAMDNSSRILDLKNI